MPQFGDQVPGLKAAIEAKLDTTAGLVELGSLDSNTPGVVASDGAGWIQKTYAQIKTALGLVKADVGLGNVANLDTSTTANITDSTNKRFVTDANLTTIGNQSGTNTGDETAARIGTLISGSSAATPNDADLVATADASVLKKITWTNIKAFLKTYFDTLYPAGSGTSTGTNTGDNAANGLYSGLAASKQDTLVSATNIKTVNGSNLLGSGDLVVSGSGITVGNAIASGTNNRFLYQNASGNLAESNGAQYDGTTAEFTDLVAPTTNLTDDVNKRFVTDANLTTIGNQSGTNTGDQTTIVGISGTKAQFDAACSDGNILFVGDAPTSHATSHKLGGGDVILLNEFGNPTGDIEFNQQQGLQFRLENRTSDPVSSAVGEIWLRTDL